MRPRSLRARLLIGLSVLVACGLAVAAVLTYAEQRSFLLDRVDQQLQAAAAPLASQLGLDHAQPPGRGAPRATTIPHGNPPQGPQTALPPGTFGALIGPNGAVRRTRTFSYGQRSGTRPSIPSHPTISGPGKLRPFTLHGRGPAGPTYRAAAFRWRGGSTVLVAVPLHEVQQTLHRLIVVEILVGIGAIAALIALGWVVIRIGLRPLERIGKTASEIAAGDLSRRVEPTDAHTEVGRLGRSLNEMLAQIEAAFAAQRDSENRLRRFLADASHELRTPLAAVRGYAELFRIGAADDPEMLARAMSRIESEAARMGVLVEDLLLLAQLDQLPEPRRDRVDLRELTEQAAEDLRVTARDREIELDATDEPAIVLGDALQLRQLIANLTRNAVVHTPAGTPIELRLRRDDVVVALAVRDHGPGLPSAEREKLFERFWRNEGGRTRGRDGAGLGLAIADAIVRAHGGTIAAADAPGGGAQFTAELAAAPVGAGASAQTLSRIRADS